MGWDPGRAHGLLRCRGPVQGDTGGRLHGSDRPSPQLRSRRNTRTLRRVGGARYSRREFFLRLRADTVRRSAAVALVPRSPGNPLSDSAYTHTGEPADAPDLGALMVAAQQGDRDAYDELLAAAQKMVLRYARRRIRSEEAAEDIAQDVLLTMHRVRHTFEPGRPFEPWMYAIARSRLIDYVRRNKRVRGHEVQTEVVPDVAEDTAEPGWDRLLEILDGLPASQREAFAMLKIEGLSTTEAAERAGVSVSALKVRAHRAYTVVKRSVLEEDEDS